jgi:hypothetical protein
LTSTPSWLTTGRARIVQLDADRFDKGLSLSEGRTHIFTELLVE